MKLLSIIIPTYNRKDYLIPTLQLLILQVQEYINEVELIVCPNNCNDGTNEALESLKKENDVFKVVNYDLWVDVDLSIIRAANNAKGKYFIIWGDDDPPLGNSIHQILNILRKDSTIGLIYNNRLVGYDNISKLSSVQSEIKEIPNALKYDISLPVLLRNHFLGMTFITSIILKKELWDLSNSYKFPNHFGYAFFWRQCSAASKAKCIINYTPICIQRKTKSKAWDKEWAKYFLIGIPNLIKDLEKHKLFPDGIKVYNSQINSFKMFMYALVSAAQYKRYYIPQIRTICTLQESRFRKVLVYLIIFLLPSKTYKVTRNILFRSRN